MKKEIGFVREHSLNQIWNAVKYRVGVGRKIYLNWDPIILSCVITSKCTLQCKMCPYYGANRSRNLYEWHGDMAFEDFKKIINMFKNAGFLSLSAMGEPFLHDNIFDMIHYGNECHMTVETSTNGTVIGDYINEILKTPLKKINVSLDAHDAVLYKRMRGSRKIFYIVVDNIQKLVEKRNKLGHKLEIGISYVTTKENYMYMPKMIDFAEGLGVDYLLFQNLIPYDISTLTSPKKSLYADDIEVKKIIGKLRKKRTKLKVTFPKLLQRKVTQRVCTQPFHILKVFPNGDAIPCCPLPTKKYKEYVVNIFKTKDAWNSEPFLRIRKMMIDESVPLLDFCKTCEPISPKKTI